MRNQIKVASFWSILTISLLVASVAALEFTASFFAPAWPRRDLRPTEPILSDQRYVPDYFPWWSAPTNSWGMRDLERTIDKRPGSRRIVFVGDSFLEGGFAHYPLPLLIEKSIFLDNRPNVEVINLGVSGTDPGSYYFRIREVAFPLQPDLLVVVFYAGNDFMSAADAYAARPGWRIIDERPRPSIMGTIAPRLTWTLTSLMKSLSAPRPKMPPREELNHLFAATRLPFEEGSRAVARHARANYAPDAPSETLEEIFRRGGAATWGSLQGDALEPELLQGWIIDNLLRWELQTSPFARSLEEAQAMLPADDLDPTMSWLRALYALADRNQVPLLVVLAPVGSVDPSFVEFWKPWPRYFSWNHICEARHARLAARMTEENLRFIDLRESFLGVPDTYRKTDAHWTDKGHAIASERILSALQSMYPQLLQQR